MFIHGRFRPHSFRLIFHVEDPTLEIEFLRPCAFESLKVLTVLKVALAKYSVTARVNHQEEKTTTTTTESIRHESVGPPPETFGESSNGLVEWLTQRVCEVYSESHYWPSSATRPVTGRGHVVVMAVRDRLQLYFHGY